MSKNKTDQTKKQTTISVDGTEYNYEDMKPEEQQVIHHITDLDRKINTTTFNLAQLQFGRTAFVNSLSQSLVSEPEEVEEV